MYFTQNFLTELICKYYLMIVFFRAKTSQELLAAAIMELLEPPILDLYLLLAVAAELGISIGKGLKRFFM